MNKNGMFKRFVSLVLSLVLVASCLPAGVLLTASAADETSGIIANKTVTDPNTMNAWKDTAFDPYNLTTEHAGGVWTDKSVIKADDAESVFVDKNGQSLGITAGTNNFLVALSALGANSVTKGESATATDTMFVLDVSGSMSSTDLDAMVTATNDAIHTLLTSNEESRVGVVLYSNSATLVLPLDRYTPYTTKSGGVTTYQYIMRAFFGYFDYIGPAGSGNNWVKNGKGENVTEPTRFASGGTYIQSGLWTAWNSFNNATHTDVRSPVIVLMSDGAPTYCDNDFNNVGNSSMGDGNNETDELAFLTQLTAAYVKEMMGQKYNATPYFYTVGLGVDGGDNTVTVAKAMLDSSLERDKLEGYWSKYHGLATGSQKTMSVGNNTVTYDSTVTKESQEFVNRYFPAKDASQLSSAFQGIVNEISLKSSYNVTRLDGSDVNSGGYVTFVDEIGTGMEVKGIKGILIGDTLYTGERLARALLNREFGTAEEPTMLGNNMVWSLKQRLGITDMVLQTENGPVTITATERIHDLIQHAYDAGQIAYNAETGEFSNLICWFSDANGNYVGFWDYADPDCAIPEGAAYANMSYGMLGTTTDSQTAHASDMMYVAVAVSKQVTQVNGVPALEAKTPEIVTFRVPASLLPTVTYEIDVQAANDDQITEETPASIIYHEAEPIRLVYEVGVHSQLTPENVQDFLRGGYQAKDANGNYYLYTNAWYWEPSDGDADFRNPPTKENEIGKEVLYDTSKNHITYAYFEPSEENEHYYHVEDTDIWTTIAGAGTEDTSDDVYERLTTAPFTDGSVTYYYQQKTYVSKKAATEIGEKVDAKVDIHYGTVDQKLIADSSNYAKGSDGVYYIKGGTMHYYSIHEHDKEKTSNVTGSFKYRLHQLVNINVEGEDAASYHSEIMYLGNNGRITYSPAQGFTLSKVMAEGATATGEFTFDVTLSGDADRKYTETRSGVSEVKDIVNNSFAVTLAAGEQVTITGIDVDATYTVTEQEREGYKLGGIDVSAGSYSGATATGTVVANQIHSITYTNDIQAYGSLLVSKSITYEKDSQPASNNAIFQMEVTLSGMAGKSVYVNGTSTAVSAEGKLILRLKDGEQALITGIPEGVAYTVAEMLADGTTDIPKGYVAANGYTVTDGNFNGTIQKNVTATAAVQNTYTPDNIVLTDAEPQISININKDFFLNNGSATGTTRTFTFELLTYDAGTSAWVPVEVNDSAIKASTTFENPTNNETNEKTGIILDLNGVELTTVGNHYFRVAEVIPEVEDQVPGMTYDRTFHDFVVVVTDTDLDGKLEISEVRNLQNAEVTGPSDRNNDGKNEYWSVSTEFYNSEITLSTKLTIAAKKTLTNTVTNENILKDGQFEFALYETNDSYDITGVEPVRVRNGANGDIVFPTITYPYADGSKYYYYVMKETSTGGNGIKVDPNEYRIMVRVDSTTVNGNAVAQVNSIALYKNGEPVNTYAAPANNVFSSITFENTYTPAPVVLPLSATKTLTNVTPGVAGTETVMNVPGGTYKFKLKALNGAPMPTNATDTEVFAKADGTVSFDAITYSEAGTYEYTVTEADTDVAGVTKDSTVYTVKVEVADDGAGQLIATVTYWNGNVQVNEIKFNNTYKAEPTGEIKLNAKKDLTVGDDFERPLNANDFRVTLTHPNGSTETVYNDAYGFFNFAPVSFDTVGSYRYAVSEIVPQGAVDNNKLDGVTYDAVDHVFTIVVEDNGQGQLVAKLGDAELSSSTATTVATIKNTYAAEPTSIRLTARKDLTGRDLNENEFSFKLEAITADAPMPTDAQDQVKNTAAGAVDFGTIKYSAIGIYNYKVTELKLDENGNPLTPDPVTGEYVYKGVTYSAKEYTVTVTVTDLRNGKLTAQISSADQDNNAQPDGIVFINTYSAAPVEGEITATKELYDLTGGGNDRLQVPADTYEFKLEALNGAPAPANSEVKAAEGGAVSFGKIEYSEAGTYQYILTEVDKNVPGVDSDPTVYTVEVEIEDDLVGSLRVKEIRYIKDGTSNTSAVFTNKYSADSVKTEITATKKLTNLTPGVTETVMDVPKDTYKFKLERITADAPMPANAEVYAAAGGAVKFDITYVKAGVYEYKLTEIDMNVPGVTNDDTEYTVKVTVKDDGQGKLYVDSITYNGAAAAVFENKYLAAPVEIHVEGDSTVTDGKIFTDESSLPENKKDLDDFEFRFTLAKKDDTVIETVSDNGAGFAFEKLKFDTVGEYVYSIYECLDNDAGVIYDYAKYRVTVTVTDSGNGQLEATVKYEKAASGESIEYEVTGGILFENSYKAKETSVTFAGKKTLTGGRELKENDFSFILKDAESGDEIATVKNDAEGNFAFDKITYNSEGTYTYTLEEKNDGMEGITYDAAKYTLTVTVKDVSGELKATTEIKKDGNAADSYGFTNLYTPEDISATISVQKELVNKSEETMGLNGFQFQLECGAEKQTLTTGADGKGKFELSFDAADIGKTYIYKLSEINGGKEHMTYDNTVYEIKITVNQLSDGKLTLKIEGMGAEAFKFVNTYEVPKEPEPTGPAPEGGTQVPPNANSGNTGTNSGDENIEMPEDVPSKTGDDSHVGRWTLMMAVSAVGALAVLVLGKKKLFEQ